MSTCSEARDEAVDPIAASAPHSRIWLAIEDPRSWGERPLMPVDWSEHGITTVLIRKPQRITSLFRIYLAFVRPGEQQLLTTEVADQRVLEGLDPSAIANGEIPTLFTLSDEKPLLICTNGKRDQCCAVKGRAYLEEALAANENVWESTHLGGHRFAPVSLTLPDGAVRAGGTLRGLSGLTRAEQAAHLAVRDEVGDQIFIDTAQMDEDHWLVTIAGQTQRFGITVSRHVREAVMESCGKEPSPGWNFKVDTVTSM
jgi:hypothetical protein